MRLRTKVERRIVASIGVRMGYWPCVRGPFVQVNIGRYYRSWWYGLEEA